MSKFKAGDKVRVLESGACCADVEAGDIGIHTGAGGIVNFPDQNVYWCINDTLLELVRDDQVNPSEPLWKINTGTMPVEEDTLVDVKHRSGQIFTNVSAGFGSAHDWSLPELTQYEGDIIEWRLSGSAAVDKSLQGSLESPDTTKQEEEVKVEQKPMMLKPFAVDCNEITAVQGNEMAKLAAQAGAELVEGLYDDDMRNDEPGEKYPEISHFSYREGYNYFGVDMDNQTYALDHPNSYDRNIIGYEDAIDMLNKIINFKPEPKVQEVVEQKVSRKVKGRVPVLHQRKAKVTYTNDKTYLLKNVVSLDVHADSETVNVVYKEKKGKVQINSNVVIPFSELKEVSFVAPESVGAVYVFKAGKVVAVTLDHTREPFRTKSH